MDKPAWYAEIKELIIDQHELIENDKDYDDHNSKMIFDLLFKECDLALNIDDNVSFRAAASILINHCQSFSRMPEEMIGDEFNTDPSFIKFKNAVMRGEIFLR
jgi:hypothetical protein